MIGNTSLKLVTLWGGNDSFVSLISINMWILKFEKNLLKIENSRKIFKKKKKHIFTLLGT